METVKQIQELTSVTTADNSDYLVLEQEEGTKKITKSNFLKEVNSSIDDLNTNIESKVWRLTDMVRIDEYQDLNNLTALGCYYCNNSTAQTLINAPYSGAFIIYVIDSLGRSSEYRFQYAISYTGRLYTRNYIPSSGWGNWYILSRELV